MKNIELFILVAGVAVTGIGLITTWVNSFRDKKYEKSLLYLNEIKSNYQKALSLISTTDNNFITWHEAVERLKIAEKLQGYLTAKAHQEIFIAEMMANAFQLLKIIQNIKDFRFFYGLSDYENKDSLLLFELSSPQFFERPTLRISPHALEYLCGYIDKINRVFYQSENDYSYHKIFKSDYFKFSTKDFKISDLTFLPGMEVVMEYIKNYNGHKLARTKKILKSNSKIEGVV